MLERVSYGAVDVLPGPLMQRGGRWLAGAYHLETMRALGLLAEGRTLVVGLGAGHTIAATLETQRDVHALERDPDVLEAWLMDSRTLPLDRAERSRCTLHAGDLATWWPGGLEGFDSVLVDFNGEDLQAVAVAHWGWLIRHRGGLLVLPIGYAAPAGFQRTLDADLSYWVRWRWTR